MKRRFIATAAVLGVAAMALAGCATGGTSAGSGSAGPIDTKGQLSGTIQFQTWSLKNATFTPYFNDIIKSFEKEHPKVKIQWIDQPGDGYQDKILSQANANTLPDVVNLPPDIAFPLAQAGKLVDLNAADPSLAKTYVPGAWKSYSYPGITGTFGLPWYLGTDLAWWNEAALKQYGVDTTALPTTQEQLIQLAIKVGKASGGKMPVVSAMPGLEELASDGVQILNSKGDFDFNTAKAAALLDQYKAVYNAGGMPPEALTGSYAGNATMFQQGKVAYTTAGSNFPGQLKENAPGILKTTLATPRTGDAPLFVQGLSVAKDSKNKAAALAFAKYVTNTENQVAFCKLASGFLPGTVAGSADAADLSAGVTEPLQLKAMKIVSDEMKTARVLTPFQWTDAMTTFMNQQVALALQGKETSKAALDKVVTYANQNKTTN